MKKLISLLILLLSLPLFAETPAYQARIGGLSSNFELLPVRERHSRKFLKVFNLYIPGLGRVRIKLNKIKANNLVSTFTTTQDNQEKVLEDNSITKFFSGVVKMKNKEHYLAASAIKLKNKPYLVVSFNGSHPRSGKVKYYKVKIPIGSNKTNKARFFVVKKLNHDLFHNDALIAPQQYTSSSNYSSQNLPRTVSAASSYKQVELNLDADKEWYDIFGIDSNAIISSYVNEAEAIYENELGITFKIVRQNVFTTLPFGNNGAVDKLCNYQFYTSGYNHFSTSECDVTVNPGPQSYFGNADNYHLFTGDNLAGSTIGLAFLGTICSSDYYSFGVTQLTSGAITPITFAHELGHSFAAIHDGSTGNNGSGVVSCPTTSTAKIMGSSISSSPPESFSNCSVDLIDDHVSTFGSCLDTVSSTSDNNDSEPSNNQENASNEYPPTVLNSSTLKIKVKDNGKIRGKLILNEEFNISDYNSCRIQFNFAKSPSGLLESNIRVNFFITSQENTYKIRGITPYGVSLNNEGLQLNGYSLATLTCDNQIISYSNEKKIATSNITSNSKVKIKKFLKNIKNNLQLK